MNNIIVEKNQMFLFHSVRGEKKTTALLLIKKPGVFGGVPVYASIDICAGLKPGEVGIFTCQYTLKPWKNEDGSVRTTKTGEPLMVLG